MKIYNKLVRDNIPSIIEKDNKKCNYHIAEEKEQLKYLISKLFEETLELAEAKTREEVLEEIADIEDVLEMIALKHNLNETDIYTKRLNKCNKNGWFKKFIILESVEEK